MSTIAARFQNPRNNRTTLVGFCLLVAFSPLVLRTLFGVLGKQVVRALPATSICDVLVRWLPAGWQLLAWVYRMNLVGAAVRLLCRAL